MVGGTFSCHNACKRAGVLQKGPLRPHPQSDEVVARALAANRKQARLHVRCLGRHADPLRSVPIPALDIEPEDAIALWSG